MSEVGKLRPAVYAHAPFLQPLAVLSASMGRDMTQVQGPGGNTSLKQDGILWVKASGTDLADAVEECVFVPVDLQAARAVVESRDDRPIPPLDIPEAEGLRPSIECSLHALMPHKVVLHNHDVNVIVWASRLDACEALSERLDGLAWAFVPYARPGLPLTRAVKEILESDTPDILVLGNHGLVVGGQTPEDAAGLLSSVRERLSVAPRPGTEPDIEELSTLCEGTAYAPAEIREAHWTALDPVALRLATGGVLYPDHVVFLGFETGVVARADRGAIGKMTTRLVAVPGAGVLIEQSAPQAAQAMAACLGLVAARFPSGVTPAYLDTEEISELLGWDAEKYRQEMARRKAAALQG